LKKLQDFIFKTETKTKVFNPVMWSETVGLTTRPVSDQKSYKFASGNKYCGYMAVNTARRTFLNGETQLPSVIPLAADNSS